MGTSFRGTSYVFVECGSKILIDGYAKHPPPIEMSWCGREKSSTAYCTVNAT